MALPGHPRQGAGCSPVVAPASQDMVIHSHTNCSMKVCLPEVVAVAVVAFAAVVAGVLSARQAALVSVDHYVLEEIDVPVRVAV